MKKIEAIIRPEKLQDIKDALIEKKIGGVTINQVMGCGKQHGWTEFIRGNEVLVHFLPKVEIKIVVEDSKVDEVVKLLMDISKTGEVGDGKIFISNIEECIRIRTGEKGNKAL